MLIDYEYRRYSGTGKLILSYLNDKGTIELEAFTWNQPKKFEVCHPGDPAKHKKYRTWDNKSIKVVNCETPQRYSVYEFIDNLPQEKQDSIFKYVEPEVYFMDIETEIVDGFPDQYEAKTRVLSIATVLKDEVLLQGLKDISDEELIQMEKDMEEYFKPYKKKYKLKYIQYESEYDMLSDLFNNYIPRMTVLTGWNFINYDWVYLVNRAERIGINPNVASFTKRLVATRKKPHERMPKHRVIVDYMDLYSKWDTSIKVKESNKLDFVASKVVGLPKLTYPGTLKTLYENDYYRFMLYNVIDTILVQLIHEKRRYLDVMLGISSLARIRMTDAFSTIAVTEGVLRKPYKEQKGIVLVSDFKQQELETIKGGWVKEPIVGMHKYVTCYDFASMYPTNKRQFGISPEEFLGIKINNTQCSFNGKVTNIEPHHVVLSIKDDKTFEVQKEVVYANEEPIVKQVLTDIYYDRKKHKKLMMQAKNDKSDLSDIFKDMKSFLEDSGINVEEELDKLVA